MVIFLWAAISTTIKFATEPSSVKFPAKVDDDARVSQAGSGLGNPAIIGFKSKTAGTFDTRLLRTILEAVILVRLRWSVIFH